MFSIANGIGTLLFFRNDPLKSTYQYCSYGIEILISLYYLQKKKICANPSFLIENDSSKCSESYLDTNTDKMQENRPQKDTEQPSG